MTGRNDNVIVAVRLRSLLPQEVKARQASVWESTGRTVSLSKEVCQKLKKPLQSYNFDFALEGSNNFEVYGKAVKHVVDSAMEGINGTVFAYGQTCSGKTFTMMGSDENPGIIRQAIQQVFQSIALTRNKKFLLRVSYLEIYNEIIHDLLNTSARDLKIHQDKHRGVFVTPLKEEIVTTAEQVLQVIQKGEMNRHTSATDYNEHSSRSHTIFQMVH